MKQLIQLSLALTLICASATALLAWVNDATKPARDKVEKEAQKTALAKVLPKDKVGEFVKVDELKKTVGEQEFTIFKAIDASGKIVGSAVQGSTFAGFSGEIKVMVGFSLKGDILRVQVLAHAETPGLGTKVTDRKRERSLWDVLAGKEEDKGPVPNEFLDKFEGKTVIYATTAKVTKDGGDVDAISGATVSSRALADAINLICAAYTEFNKPSKGVK